MLNGTLTGAPGVGVIVSTDTLANNVIGNPSIPISGQVNVTGAASIPAAGNYTSQVTFVGPTPVLHQMAPQQLAPLLGLLQRLSTMLQQINAVLV